MGARRFHFRPDELESSTPLHGAHRTSADHVCARGILDDVDLFDAAFFGITPKEAEILDPQQRLFLEAAWEACEDAGYDPKSFAGPIGVFGGASNNSYLQNVFCRDAMTDVVGWLTTMMGNEGPLTTCRLQAHLRGPINIQTACSTSLVAVCTAVKPFQPQCDLVLRGVPNASGGGVTWHDGGITSRDGRAASIRAVAPSSAMVLASWCSSA
jgi:acyl transferase domain-containing protein